MESCSSYGLIKQGQGVGEFFSASGDQLIKLPFDVATMEECERSLVV